MTSENQQTQILSKIAAYTDTLMKDPHATVFVPLAEAYRKMGLLLDARRIAQKGLEHHPDFASAHVVLARIACQMEQYDVSQKAFEKALELDADSLAALVGFARLGILLDQNNQARTLLLRARSLSPADPVINKLLLSLPEQQVEVAVAQEEEIESPEEGGISSLVSTTLADLYLNQGFKEKALQLYRQLLWDNPQNRQLLEKIRHIEGEPETIVADEFSVEHVEPSASPLTILNRWIDNIHRIKTRRVGHV